MDACCSQETAPAGALQRRFGRVLWIVLTINAAMFVIEFGAGLAAGSSALLADSLDMLGDALLYAVSLYAVGRSARWRAGVSLLKGGAMGALGLLVAAEVAWTLLSGRLPEAPVMGAVGVLALFANLACVALLFAFRRGEINMRSTWLCSRNDVIANLGVLTAAAGVAWSGSAWPDILVGSAIAAIVLHSALGVVHESARQLAPDFERGG